MKWKRLSKNIKNNTKKSAAASRNKEGKLKNHNRIKCDTMLKKIPIPKRYAFFTNEKAIQKIFSEKRDDFFPNSRGIFIEKIDCSSLRLGGVLKIFIKYLVGVQYANKTEQRLLYGISRFGGTSRNEFLILQYFWKNNISAKN